MQVQLGSLRYSNETSAVKDDGYLEPKDLDETVSELHFSALGSELTVLTQEHADFKGFKLEGPFRSSS